MTESIEPNPSAWEGLFESFPYGLVLADRQGRLLKGNERAVSLLGGGNGLGGHAGEGDPPTCCAVLCDRAPDSTLGGACLTDFALRINTRVPEIRIDLASEGEPTAAWVSAFTIGRERSRVLFQLRPGSALDRRQMEVIDLSSFPALRISALGGFAVDGPDGSIRGSWLGQRPGQLLKYLVTERAAVVPSEQIAEALWPGAGHREAVANVRQYVHQLRAHLEPDRSPGDPSLYIVTRKGGYALEGIWIDVDEFEHRIDVGLRTLARGHEETARRWLIEAREFYGGDFLASDAYFEWAWPERDRLRELAARMLRTLVKLELGRGDFDAALVHARDLAEMEPFDADVQRELLRLCMRIGRHGEAVRRHDLYRTRLRRRFGEEPAFSLTELKA